MDMDAPFYSIEEGKEGKESNTPEPSDTIDNPLDFELSDLDPHGELSFDLSQLIAESQGVEQGVNLFPELLGETFEKPEDIALDPMPQQIVSVCPTPSQVVQVKTEAGRGLGEGIPQEYVKIVTSQEPLLTTSVLNLIDFDHLTATALKSEQPQLETLNEAPATVSVSPSQPESSNTGRNTLKAKSKKRRMPKKDTEEYRDRRDRNNVAVRKSRDKAKQKQQETESKLGELTAKNENLQKKVDLLTKELTVLRGLFINVGVNLPQAFHDYMQKNN